MWGIPALAMDICSLCQLLEDRPKSAASAAASSSPSSTARRRSSNCARGQKKLLRQQQQQLELDTDTVVIGNGPAGIALSALLSGWHPVYNRRNPHPDPRLHEQFLRMAGGDDDEQSLLEQDIGSLADQYFAHSETASAGGHTPFAVLYDCLVRPHLNFAGQASTAVVDDEQFVDNGAPLQQRPPSSCPSSPAASSSCLCWRRCETSTISHIVLGDQQIGGSWTDYDDDMVTVSAAEWMDLPGHSLAADFMGVPSLAQQRPRAGLYKNYLNAYVQAMGLRQNFRPSTKVTQIEKLSSHPLTGERHWLLRGVETVQKTAEQRPFVLRCRHVVLACGRQQPKMLGVPGEIVAADDDDHGRRRCPIVYSLSALKQSLEETFDDAAITRSSSPSPMEVSADCPVVVVGDGISAADAVLHCLSIEQPVLHIVRRSERELRNIQLSRLSSTIYPEYARVYRLLTGRTREVNYRRILGTSVCSIGDDGIAGGGMTQTGSSGVLLLSSTPTAAPTTGEHQQGQQQLREQPFRALAVCIGRRSEMPMLKEYMHSSGRGDDLSCEFTTRYQSVTDPSLFAIGAMAGDHFVRYLVGGALCVAQTIITNERQQQRTRAVLSATVQMPLSSGAFFAKTIAKMWAANRQSQQTNDVTWHGRPVEDDNDDTAVNNGCHRRDIGTDCAIMRTAASSTGSSPTTTTTNPLLYTTAAAVVRAKQFIGRAKSQLQLSRPTATPCAATATVV